MSALSQQEIQKIRKAAEETISLSGEMKSTAIDQKFRQLSASVKKLLAKKDVKLDIFVMKGKTD
jgi:hypothetical protein